MARFWREREAGVCGEVAGVQELQELQNKNWNGIPGTMFTEEQDGIVTESSPRRCRGMKIAARPRGERIEKRAR
jgi:hypothetical protein